MSVNGDALTGMFFEVTPHPGHSEHYFSYVEELKPELVKYSGLVWINRYQSVSDDSSLLSYQLWDNEKSSEKWRNNKRHRLAQEAGIKTHFKNYRIRVGERIASWPVDPEIKLNTESAEKFGLLLLSIESDAVIPHSVLTKYGSFEGVYCGLSGSNQFVSLLKPSNLLCGQSLASAIIPSLAFKIDLFLISRDYSMPQRSQASLGR